MELENMVALVSRTGRHLQRYDNGRRQVVGYFFSLLPIIKTSNWKFVGL